MTVFGFEDEGVATLEDGLYVVEGRLQDPLLVDRMVRFVRASMRAIAESW
jgi:NitT/TauT family transport system substrate-binding protein